MIQHLFPDFLENPDSYHRAELYWEDLMNRVLGIRGSHHSWHTFVPRRYSDGTPFQDGNPIFDSRSPEARRAVRVIQERPDSDSVDVDAYFDRIGPDHLDELVIRLALSVESGEIAERLIAEWVDPATSMSDTGSLIETLLPPQRPTGE